MVLPLLAAAGISAAGSLASAGLSSGINAYSQRKQNAAQGKANKPYMQHQERKNRLIDELLASIEGNGKYSGLFKNSEADFQKSFVDPAKARFNNQIAPQIQQQSIYGGTDNSSQLDDQLLRAGVNMDQLLNQSYADYQNKGKDRIQNTLNSILGQSAPMPLQAQTNPSPWADAAQGFLQSGALTNLIGGLTSGGGQTQTGAAPQMSQQQIDALNPPTFRRLDASNPRQGFINNNTYA